jgi:parallel beta-helix repeat protein
MNKSLGLILVLLSSLVICSISTQPVRAQTYLNIHINSDGSIRGIEGTQDIQRIGDTYVLKNSINGSIFVEKDNITIDGAGYSIQGSGSGTGIGVRTSGVTIKNLQIKEFSSGISFSSSSNNIAIGCNIIDCSHGISLRSSSNNTFSGNYLYNNTIGIDFSYSPNNFFTNNSLEDNSQPLWFEHDWVNSIDSSNTINGKPVYYFVNQRDLVINPSGYPEIGYLAFVNCTRIIVKNLDYSNSQMGIVMVSTTNSTITQNRITNNWRGIYLYGSYGNSITGNYVANNEIGIYIETTSANTIAGNDITNNECGISIEGANQIIYHNNFIDNSRNANSNGWYFITSAPLFYGVHVWDNGYPSGGNYWSDYNGIDANHDGLGDTPYVLNENRNNTDRYPLMRSVDVTIDLDVTEFPSSATPSSSAGPSQNPTSTSDQSGSGNAALLSLHWVQITILASFGVTAVLLVVAMFMRRRTVK